jgi:endonuclease/exonuclease/phosphatase family metal-dependent hydrolase
MTFNIRGALSPDGRNAWPFRRRLLLSVIEAWAPDVLALQEAIPFALRWLDKRLPNYSFFSGLRSGPRVIGPHNALGISSRLSVRTHGSHWLAAEPDRPVATWGARHLRALNWLSVECPTERPLIVANLHLDHISGEARDRGSALAIATLRGLGYPDEPTVVLGDFNSEPGSATHCSWIEAGFVDSWSAAGHDDGAVFTVHNFHGDPLTGETRIDWALVGGPITVAEAWVDTANQNGRYPSDHFPVVADLKWPS